jgi:hypothetical protein
MLQWNPSALCLDNLQKDKNHRVQHTDIPDWSCAVAGSELPKFLAKMGFSMESVNGGIADNIKYSFYIGALVLLAAIVTIYSGSIRRLTTKSTMARTSTHTRQD